MSDQTPTKAPTATNLVFLCGADMNPEIIRRRTGLEDARFTTIACAGSDVATRAGLPDGLGDDDIWGIALTGATLREESQALGRDTVTIRMPDGSSGDALLLTNPTTVGIPAAILAEARYWELPRDYCDRLEALTSA